MEAHAQGMSFGRYRLINLIGRGGMGEVWRARDELIGRTVALKVLPPNYADDPQYRERFRREALKAASLNHPHIVTVLDVGEIEGRLFVTMPVIEGRELQAYLNEGPVSPELAVAVVEQIATALTAAHHAGLVHRDVKPSNILLTDDDFAYLIDFGIARAESETGLTSTGLTVGTWGYMAPERFRSGLAEPSADTYALTCVLYQCLTGCLPFPGSTFEQIALAHIADPPPKPSESDPAIPRTLDEVIATGLAKDPAQRYGSPTEMAAAARTALSQRPHTGESTPPQRTHPQGLTTDDATGDAKTAISNNSPEGHAAPASAGEPTVMAETREAPSSESQADRDTPRTEDLPAAPGIRSPLIKGRGIRMSERTKAAAVVAVAIIGGGGYWMAHHSQDTPTSDLALVTTSTLDGLLLTPAEASTAIAAPGLRSSGRGTMSNGAGEVVSPPQCRAVFTEEIGSYENSGFTADIADRLVDNPMTTVVDQAVVLYPTAQTAQSFYNDSAARWASCANHTVSSTFRDGHVGKTAIGQVSNKNGVLSVQLRDDDGPTYQHALTAAANVLIDVTVLSAQPADEAVAVARRIAAKVPK
ncbi:serine/threonine-protein kinase PknH/PknJ [Mycobacterium sp. TY815]|uniref:serine/threonine-protein kinase PknH/PknJ n=1 Tax=Mycobacterium sp. TY815 TaxID=3050581 RepID=UPI002740CF45|nr:sensor domain-containing protein [Mycobacterium sp. TY815]MDP7707434.1 sensor domain-containing protein [Mycobacterium sp. TY815]